MARFRLGERVRFTAQVQKVHEDRLRLFRRIEKLPFIDNTWGTLIYIDEGLIMGYRHVTDGITEPGSPGGWTMDGYDGGDPSEFIQHKGTTRKVWIVSYDLRKKPILVFDDDIQSIDGDRLLPYQHQKMERLADGTKVWPGDPRWGIRARTPFAPDLYVEQVVVAYSLVGALEEAMNIPLQNWLPFEED